MTETTRRAIKDRSLTGNWSARTLYNHLLELQAWEGGFPARRKYATKINIAMAVSSLAGVIGCFLIWNATENLVYILLILLGVALLQFYAAYTERGVLPLAMQPEITLTLLPLLRLLNQDIHPDRKIRVQIDLGGFDETRLTNRVERNRGPMKKVTVSSYGSNVFRIRLPLADDSEAAISLRNRWRKAEYRKQNARKKIKTRTRWTRVSQASVALVPPMASGRKPARLKLKKKSQALFVAPENVLPASDILSLLIRLAVSPGGKGKKP